MVFGGRRRAPRKIAACAVVVLAHHVVPVDKVVDAVIVGVVASAVVRARVCSVGTSCHCAGLHHRATRATRTVDGKTVQSPTNLG